jgi:hypothetical protein
MQVLASTYAVGPTVCDVQTEPKSYESSTASQQSVHGDNSIASNDEAVTESDKSPGYLRAAAKKFAGF